mmetsp:Transcript_23244/g.17664  ORF Transcript_23244/g.17664 Transcript_23244/m.17664 type:complete len:112 (+) Transcript_23244:826-1161(+)
MPGFLILLVLMNWCQCLNGVMSFIGLDQYSIHESFDPMRRQKGVAKLKEIMRERMVREVEVESVDSYHKYSSNEEKKKDNNDLFEPLIPHASSSVTPNKTGNDALYDSPSS